MSGRWPLLGAFAVALASGFLPASAGATQSTTVKVEIRNFAFGPKALTIHAGTRVVWTNLDEEPHTVTSAGGTFKSSAALDTDDSYAVTFARAGTYTYYCAIHPMMVGTVVVQ